MGGTAGLLARCRYPTTSCGRKRVQRRTEVRTARRPFLLYTKHAKRSRPAGHVSILTAQLLHFPPLEGSFFPARNDNDSLSQEALGGLPRPRASGAKTTRGRPRGCNERRTCTHLDAICASGASQAGDDGSVMSSVCPYETSRPLQEFSSSRDSSGTFSQPVRGRYFNVIQFVRLCFVAVLHHPNGRSSTVRL